MFWPCERDGREMCEFSDISSFPSFVRILSIFVSFLLHSFSLDPEFERGWLDIDASTDVPFGSTYAGVQYITANTNSEPTSYMTCMLGRPLDGERCHIRSYMSVDRDLVIEAFRMPTIGS